MNRRALLAVALLGVAVAWASVVINPPLARLPWQDLLWNDLVLANRVAWLSDALGSGTPAAVDFLQGPGTIVHSDIKVIPHFYEPAAWLALIVDLPTALDGRLALLTLYCALSLYQLTRRVREAGNRDAGVPFPLLLLAYVFAPQLLGEVSHHFSAIYYAAPGLLLAWRRFVATPDWRSMLLFSAVSTIFVHLSDVHVVFIAPTLFGFVYVLDRSTRKAPFQFHLLAGAIFVGIVGLSYLAVPASLAHRDPTLVVNAGTWPAAYYWSAFLKPVLWTLLFPTFAGPVCLYVLPWLFFLLVPLASRETRGPYLPKLGWLLVVVTALAGFGLVLHGVDSLRAKLPSAMRYHLTAIPFLTVFFVVFAQDEIGAALARLRRSVGATLGWMAVMGVVFLLIARHGFNPESEAFLAFNGSLVEPGVFTWRRIGFSLLIAYPFGYLLFGLVAGWLERSPLRQFAASLVAVIFVAGGYYTIRAFSVPQHNQTCVDGEFRNRMLKEIPERLSGLIAASAYAGAPRSFVPIAQGVIEPSVGRNDKLLPLIELPETYGGRSFLQWRYSYSAHAQKLYVELTATGPVNFYPPTPDRLEQAIAFAWATDSPFLLSADAELNHPALVHLGQIEWEDLIIRKHPRVLNDGLIGSLHLYVLPEVARVGSRPAAEYRRTQVKFRPPLPAEGGWVRLPITYFPALRAHDDANQRVELRPAPDGFTLARQPAVASALTVSSFSWIGLASLCSPLIGPLLWLLARNRLRPRPSTER